MPLPIHPEPGTILICDYDTGFRAPEMIKKRLCVTVSPRLKRRNDLIAIVPLSQSKPVRVEDWHHRIDIDVPAWGSAPRWAKCDMIATVGFHRLDRPYIKTQAGGRQYQRISLAAADIAAIRAKVIRALGGN